MRPLRHVVLGTDFSHASSLAQARAQEVAREHAAVLHVVHASRPLPGPLVRRFFGAGAVNPEESERARLRSAVADVRGGGIECHAHYEKGAASRALAAVARRVSAPLIVIGARGRSFADALIGSTAERVASLGAAHVLVVRRERRTPYGKAIVATDAKESLPGAVAVARAWFPRARVEVFHAYEAPFEEKLIMSGVRGDALRDYRAAARRRAKAALEAALAEGEVSVNALVLRHGDARLEVPRAARGELVVLVRERAPVRHAVLGGVTRAVLAEGSSDVLLV